MAAVTLGLRPGAMPPLAQPVFPQIETLVFDENLLEMLEGWDWEGETQ